MALPTNRRISLSPPIKRLYLFDHDIACPKMTVLMITFALGMVVGAQLWGSRPLLEVPLGSQQSERHLLSGSIHRLEDTPFRHTAHRDENGRPVMKQQLIEAFIVPNVAGYSVASVLPGQRVDSHEHATMHEFFYVLEGSAIFTIDGKETTARPGTFFHLAPHEVHGIFVPPDSADGEMKMLVSGVVVENR